MSDPRITPARPDLAAARLKGKVEAARFADGTLRMVARGRAGLHAERDAASRRETELLFGEGFTVYEVANGWAWGQSALDDYVGYVAAGDLRDVGATPDHRVIAPLTPLLPAPDFKLPVRDMLPMNAKVKVVGQDGRFAKIAPEGFVFAGHLAPIRQTASDWVAVAERFRGVPYVWGGKTVAGIDCSGLVQTSLEAGGIAAPRDADMQELALGIAIPPDLSRLARGDLVFWTDHVGVMLDAVRLLHANAFYMEAAVEPLADAAGRIANRAGPITSIKRL
ncbi:MAG: NlpC/P60 family protein [Rhizomicrobium sp.]